MFNSATSCRHSILGFAVVFLFLPFASLAKDRPQGPTMESGDTSLTVEEMRTQLRDMRSAVQELRQQVNRLHDETATLRRELTMVQAGLAGQEAGNAAANEVATAGQVRQEPEGSGPVTEPASSAGRDGHERSRMEEDIQLLEAKVNDQYQTKVGSASKYRIRLSGMALLNVFSNRGAVDNMDVPGLAIQPTTLSTNSSFGATARQTMLGLEVFGPDLAGARTRGAMQMDFFGGIPNQLNGAALGVMRIRTATFEMDWTNTKLVAGLDAPFISPLSPSSIATVAEPAFSYSGNLWTWTPQIRVEHRLTVSDTSNVLLQVGILDPLTGEPPYYGNYRYPQAGERAGQPAYATRIAWTGRSFGNPVAVGVGGYYSRQNWGFNRTIDGWAGTLDWNIPLAPLVSFSGEFYRGRAIGGLGGGIGRSVVYNGSLLDPATTVVGLDSVGGWGQLQFRPTQRWELNGGFGQDNPLAEDVRLFYPGQSYFDASLARNRTSMANFIFRPRSNLLLSLEYRRLWTYDVDGEARMANHLNLGIGVLF